MFSEIDHQHMSRAIELAARAMNTTTPNPRVGCVIVRDGQVVGEGWHQVAGGPHAEVRALEAAAGHCSGASAYVTLEPCSHDGRTGPCAQALVRAGIKRVFVAMDDPNEQVNGKGLAILRAAGIDVRCGLLESESRELNPGFISRMRRQRPWVRLKVAGSLDGMSALPDGASQWITGLAARTDGHRWRARACALLTGIGTVRDDDPLLNVRLVDTDRQPLKVIVDSRLQIDMNARILKGGSTLLVCSTLDRDKAQELRDRGVEVIALANAQGKVDLAALLAELAKREINELHIEAGFKLNGSLIRESLVDELLFYQAPSWLGAATGLANLAAVPSLQERHQMRFQSVERIGDDLRIIARFNDIPDASGTTHGVKDGVVVAGEFDASNPPV